MRILKPNDRATMFLLVLGAIGAFTFTARLLLLTDTFHTGLLYLALPFVLSLLLYYLTPHTDGATWKRRSWNSFRLTMIVVLTSAFALGEGFVCLIFFMPIFVLMKALALLVGCLPRDSGRGRFGVAAIPAVVLLLSLEGTTNLTTFDRCNEVSYSRIVQADVNGITERLTQPISFQENRHWFLAVFPLPRSVGNTDLQPGDTRTYDFVYDRWVFTNTHTGRVDVTFTEIGPDRIVTAIQDTSYLSHYMNFRGTEFTLDPIGETQTRVTLTVKFDRRLDPVWYFEPLQRFAVHKAAAYFIEQTLGDATWPTGSPSEHEPHHA